MVQFHRVTQNSMEVNMLLLSCYSFLFSQGRNCAPEVSLALERGSRQVGLRGTALDPESGARLRSAPLPLPVVRAGSQPSLSVQGNLRKHLSKGRIPQMFGEPPTRRDARLPLSYITKY